MIEPTRKPASRRRARPATNADAYAPLLPAPGAPESPAGVHAGDAGEAVSKTRRKAHSHALQALGLQLVELPEGKLESIPLPDALRRAILAARTINAREGRRRQLQYIGKLMRSADAAPIADALARDGQSHRREVAAMHAAEAWRDGLIDGTRSLATFVDRHPDAASRPLAQLLSLARRERAAGAPGAAGASTRHARTLYRALLQAIESPNDATPDEESFPRDASGRGGETEDASDDPA